MDDKCIINPERDCIGKVAAANSASYSSGVAFAFCF